MLALLLVPAARASAQQVDVSLVWASDLSVNPPVYTCSRSGSVAGFATVHIRFTPPPGGCMLACVSKLTIVEQTGHVPGPTGTGENITLGFTGWPNPLCGDPPSGPNMYCDFLWQTVMGWHNSPHDITVQVRYTTWDFATHTTPDTSITVSPCNLQIAADTPANPDPILWDPDMSFCLLWPAVSAAYRHEQLVTLKIYTPNQTLVKTLQDVVLVGPGVSFPVFMWDGSIDWPVLGTAPKGIYLFTWEAEWPTPWYDHDTDKSTFLSIAPAGSPSGYPVYDGYEPEHVDFRIQYDLTDNMTPGKNASAGRVVLYEPAQNDPQRFAYTMGDTAKHLGQHTATAQPVSVEVPAGKFAELGAYTLRISARDDQANKDRAHRQRWALQNNNNPGYREVQLTEPAQVDGEPQAFRGGIGQAAGCKVVIRGVVAGVENAKPLVKYTYCKMGLNDQQQGVVVAGHEEQEIPADQIDKVNNQVPPPEWDAANNGWKLQIAWEQRLGRTLKDEDPAHPDEPTSQAWVLKAHALCAPLQTAQPRSFCVMKMAYPVAGDPIPQRGWLATWAGDVTTTGYNAAPHNRSLEVKTQASAPHLGIDYGGAYESNINAAEYGQVKEGDFNHQDQWSGIQPPSAVDSALDQKEAWERANPGETLDMTYEPASWNNGNNLGPHRRVEHGPVNMAMNDVNGATPALMYDRGTVKSAYGHVKEPKLQSPAPDDRVDISETVAQVGRLENNSSDPFGLGDFRGVGGKLVFRHGGQKVFDVAVDLVVWASTTAGSHLHFEVRVDEKVTDQRPKGQVDPNEWVSVGYGLKR